QRRRSGRGPQAGSAPREQVRPTRRGRGRPAAGADPGDGAEGLTRGEPGAPLQGAVQKGAVEKGATVEEGALICVIEAMKMENEITAPSAGTVEELGISEGGSVATGDTIAVIK